MTALLFLSRGTVRLAVQHLMSLLVQLRTALIKGFI